MVGRKAQHPCVIKNCCWMHPQSSGNLSLIHQEGRGEEMLQKAADVFMKERYRKLANKSPFSYKSYSVTKERKKKVSLPLLCSQAAYSYWNKLCRQKKLEKNESVRHRSRDNKKNKNSRESVLKDKSRGECFQEPGTQKWIGNLLESSKLSTVIRDLPLNEQSIMRKRNRPWFWKTETLNL